MKLKNSQGKSTIKIRKKSTVGFAERPVMLRPNVTGTWPKETKGKRLLVPENPKHMGLGKPGKGIIFNLNEIIECRLEKVSSPKTCRVFGSVVIDGGLSPKVEILLDSGASFSY